MFIFAIRTKNNKIIICKNFFLIQVSLDLSICKRGLYMSIHASQWAVRINYYRSTIDSLLRERSEAAAEWKTCSAPSGHLSCVAAMYTAGPCLTHRGPVVMGGSRWRRKKEAACSWNEERSLPYPAALTWYFISFKKKCQSWNPGR